MKTRCACRSASHGPACPLLSDEPQPEPVATILPRALREIRGPSRRPRPDMAPLTDSRCRGCGVIWRTATREDACPSCRKESRS